MKSNVRLVFVSFFFSFSLLQTRCSSDRIEPIDSENPAAEGDQPLALEEPIDDVEEVGLGIADISVVDFNLPPQDADGFTILTPNENSRLVYVHASEGNDDTGQVYESGDAVIGDDPTNPNGEVAAFASVAEAFAQMRDGEPDWMLLASGEHWEESLDLNRGRSASERAVITAYGEGGRPQLRTGTNRGIRSGQPRFVIVSGINFWAHSRDDESEFFSSFAGEIDTKSFRIFTFANEAAKIEDVLIEDCVFRSYVTAEILGSTAPDFPMERVAFRRNIFSRNYSSGIGIVHSQGIYHDGADDNGQAVLLLEENTFDHNGWRIQAASGLDNNPAEGQATGFNHNIYFSSAKNVVVQGNFFLRGSSAGNKWRSDTEGNSHNVLINNNLFFDNEVSLSIGGNASDSYRFQNFEVINNVITDMGLSRPTNRELGWGIDFNDVLNGIVDNNIITRQENPEVTTVYAMAVYATAGSEASALQINNNIVHNISANPATTPNWGSGMVRMGGDLIDVQFEDNQFYFNRERSGTLITYFSTDVNFGGNQYFSVLEDDRWFAFNDAFMSLEAWQNEVEMGAALLDVSQWPNPDRNIDSYSSAIGLGSTNEDFIDALYQQSRNNWDSRLSAPVVNAWIRAGFGK
ncbi:hypothetical protein [Maribacter sp. 4G9]|uniref:hypothetical protein n=1 Tax=Maribacter sp. 4G9 TaxID=1889777 RepID=UPI000C153D01|nr:hypothetical protein [Maribacter sp. 4G9]PIB38428.1 hypothetical protein BFP75_16105 [Maribacter sp. 4G9]